MIKNTTIDIDSYDDLFNIIMSYKIDKICVMGNMFFIDELDEEFCPDGILPNPNEYVFVLERWRKAIYFMDVTKDYIRLEYLREDEL